LNIVEIEISVLGGQYLKRRIGSKKALGRETAAYLSDRNARRAKVLWGFSVQQLLVKRFKLYTKRMQEFYRLGIDL